MQRQENLNTFLQTACANSPDKLALRDHGEECSYRGLHAKVQQLARVLHTMGVGPGQFVGAYMAPGTALVATMLAITRIGAIFVPMDLSNPEQRLKYMREDAGLSLIIAAAPHPAIPEAGSTRYLYLNSLDLSDVSTEEVAAVLPLPTDTCYVIYTSGTTGDPKGVLVNYAGAMNTITCAAQAMDVRASHRLLQLSPISFDVFVLEVGMVLLHGATLVFQTDSSIPFDTLLRQENIHHILCTPTSVATVDLRGTPLHSVMFGGEILPASTVEKYLSSFRMVHAYGITEATICSTLEICSGGKDPVPMGTALANTTLQLLDEDLQPVAPGEVGEIVLSGRGISNGYLGRPELTAQRFLPDPAQPGKMRFRTGDLARRTPEGDLLFMGRRDRQIKYREHRLELSEVEALLLRHPEVLQAAVLVQDDQLYAFVSTSQPKLQPESLVEYVGQFLPACLVPAVRLEGTLPLTPHNKIDY
ncbi:MAG TPA: amino acid adenylation domain-containing protein, partial [Myxococcota bacterium]|nr:amino acid adenylation domain-containing protein [Myxococcota bacterium]